MLSSAKCTHFHLYCFISTSLAYSLSLCGQQLNESRILVNMFSDSVKYKDMDNFKCTYIFDKDLMRNPESDKYVSFYNATMQAVLVAADCNPKWLTKHIPTLASTRQVPVLCIKDNKGGSVRLGHVVNIRTALAIGVKVSLFSSHWFQYALLSRKYSWDWCSNAC